MHAFKSLWLSVFCKTQKEYILKNVGDQAVLVPFVFHCIENKKTLRNIPNIFFYVPQKKEAHSILKRHEGECRYTYGYILFFCVHFTTEENHESPVQPMWGCMAVCFQFATNSDLFWHCIPLTAWKSTLHRHIHRSLALMCHLLMHGSDSGLIKQRHVTQIV